MVRFFTMGRRREESEKVGRVRFCMVMKAGQELGRGGDQGLHQGTRDQAPGAGLYQLVTQYYVTPNTSSPTLPAFTDRFSRCDAILCDMLFVCSRTKLRPGEASSASGTTTGQGRRWLFTPNPQLRRNEASPSLTVGRRVLSVCGE